ncbi:MAG: hypothetical protein K2J10_12490 [Muribaculaceae bacterium]|nr:hypothetical protein [Muribaculaceae bacterium]
MKSRCLLALSVIVSAMLSCGHRTVKSSAIHSDSQSVSVGRVAVCDSATMQRLLNASIRQPKIVIFRGHASGDTSVVVISADEIVVGDSIAITSTAVRNESDSASMSQAVVEQSQEKASTPRRLWAWMLVAFGALVALIVLSWRGTGSRR